VTEQSLLRTTLYDTHVTLGARMVPFSGYSMPVQYEGILAEVRAVRTGAGLFDVSHMGRFLIDGDDARGLLDWVHTGDISEDMPIGRARYGTICKRDGGIIDDAIVYRIAESLWMLIANAGNKEAVLKWLHFWRDERFPQSIINDSTEHLSMIALQGPKAIEIISSISTFDPEEVKPFNITRATIDGDHLAFIARTGYTGEDGVEIMPHAEETPRVWKMLTDLGAVPSGLGARDTLRLEAGLLLHGFDMNDTINPIEAGLNRFIPKDGVFCGSEVVQDARQNGTDRTLIAFRTLERGPVPRSHASILATGESVGDVTSGGFSPTLDMNIGLGYVPPRLSPIGTSLTIDVRGKMLGAEVVALPFYKRPR
jgi:aminomethyltransferase